MTTAHTPSPGRQAPAMPRSPVEGPIAWQARDLKREDWLVPVPGQALNELSAMAERFNEFSGGVEGLPPLGSDSPATMAVVADIQWRIDTGVGFAVLDRLPVEGWSEAAARAVAWLLANAVNPAVEQKWTGTRIYDVRDTGARLGYGVRRSLTNLKQDMHTDGPWLGATPHNMGLACVRQAADGGMSRVASLVTVHNRLLAAAPDLLARLYQPFHWDRQAEHGEGDTPASWQPVFAWNGERLGARYYDDYVRNGYRLMGATMDETGRAALDAMRAIVEAPETVFEFRLEPGQLFLLDNHRLAHGRSEFRDQGAVAGGRLLLRLWLRRTGGTGFEANPAPGR